MRDVSRWVGLSLALVVASPATAFADDEEPGHPRGIAAPTTTATASVATASVAIERPPQVAAETASTLARDARQRELEGAWVDAEYLWQRAYALSSGTFEVRLGLADALAALARWEEAAVLTTALRSDYPEDPSVVLRDAWVAFNLGRYAEAEDAYQEVEALSPDHPVALLGLAWTAVRIGDDDEAEARFRRVLALAPGDTSAQEGLALVTARAPIHTSAVSLAELDSGHAWRKWGLGGAVSADTVVKKRLALGGVFRYLHIRGPGSSSAGGNTIDHFEGWLRSRWLASETTWFGAGGGYAYYAQPGYQGTRWSPTSGVIFAEAHVTPLALLDLTLSVTESFYADFGVTQVGLEARYLLTPWLAVKGSVEGQLADGNFTPNGRAALVVFDGGWSLEVFGRFGTRRRPVELDVLAIYNYQNTELTGSAGLRATFPITGGLGGTLSLDYELARSPTSTTPTASTATTYDESSALRVGLGVTYSF